MTEAQSEEVTALLQAISIQGDKVRQLKADKADQKQIDAEVKRLVELKGSLPSQIQQTSNEQKKEKPSEGKKVDERAAKKEARRLARTQKPGQAEDDNGPVEDVLEATCGDLVVCQSRKEDKMGRRFLRVSQLTPSYVESIKGKKEADSEVWIRGYLHIVRGQSKLAFLLVRQGIHTVQCVVSDKKIASFASKISLESVVDVCGVVVKVDVPTKATQSLVELQCSRVFVVSRSITQLPFQVIDASRPEKEIVELEAKEEKVVRVGLDTRLDNRWLDLRTPFSNAIIHITSAVCKYFRDFLHKNDFVEIQTPKLLGGASEGGAEIFRTNYFGQQAFLAQSPQLHKQMSAACSGLERVFEIAPVFRAENSNTNRHLCEFQGMDLEMCFNEHYHEILDLFSDLFHYVFKNLNEQNKKEIEVVREYIAFEDLVYEAPDWIEKDKIAGITTRTLKLEFKDAIALLRAAGVGEEEQPSFDDLSTPVEKKIGVLVKEKYGVDFYFIDKFPIKPRPFYTMPCPDDSRLSNSYDFFIRGQEIMSGAQRVHDAALLEQKIIEKGIPVETLRFYIDSFKTGALPHGGGGVGLERVVMLFLALPNIRLARMYPRDPVRLMP